jgi:hypothetical protein
MRTARTTRYRAWARGARHNEGVAAPVVIEDGGDGWWEGPSAVECDVCWERPGVMEGTLSQGGDTYWLLRLRTPMRDPEGMAEFEHVLVLARDRDLSGAAPLWHGTVTMYPVLRRVEPGEHVSLDGELLPGVKARIRRS